MSYCNRCELHDCCLCGYNEDGEKVKIPRKWVQKDGSKINYKDMSDKHLQNALNYLKNKKFEYNDVRFVALEMELRRRGL